MVMMDTETRLLKHVYKDTKTGCWVWTGSKDPCGYGKICNRYSGKSKVEFAHRVIWKCINGDPGELFVLHKCDNPGCINPEHLFLGTNADNMRDMVLKGRSASGKRNGRGSAKLTEKDVRAIRASKLPYRALTYRYGVSVAQIYRIRARRSWKHI